MIWTSPHPPLAEADATLPALVLEAAARQPGRRALVDGPSGGATSFAQLTERSERVALGLAAHGFGAGDTLALWAPNVPGWASLALGALMAGGALTGVNPTAVERELVNQLADTRACLLATLPALAEPARAAAAAAGLAEPLVFDGAAADLERTLEVGPVARPTAEAPRARPPASKRTPGDRSHRAPALEPGSTALLPLSSGTTGLPKAVVLSHRNLAASVRQVSLALALGERDTVLAVAPFAHVMGFLVTLAAPLSVGATVVTLPRFQLDAALAIVARASG